MWEDPSLGSVNGTGVRAPRHLNATAVLEKLNADGTWERVDSQPRVPISVYHGSSNDGRTVMTIVLNHALTEPLTTKVVLATKEYPSQLLCSSDEFTVRALPYPPYPSSVALDPPRWERMSGSHCSSPPCACLQLEPPAGPPPSPYPNQQMPLWVWPVASIGILLIVVCCYGLVSCGSHDPTGTGNPRGGGAAQGFPPHNGFHHQPLLEAADAHPIQPPNRPSLFAMPAKLWRLTANAALTRTMDSQGSGGSGPGGGGMEGRGSISSTPLEGFPTGSGSPRHLQGMRGTGSYETYSPRGSSIIPGRDPAAGRLSQRARVSSFRARADNRRSALGGMTGAVQWVRAMNPSGWVQWVRSDLLPISSEEQPPVPPGPMGAVHWVRRLDAENRAWLVRSDDMALVTDFTLVDKEEVAALPHEEKIRWFRHELEQRLLPAHAAGGPVKFTMHRGEELRLMIEEFDALEMHDMRRTFRFRCPEPPPHRTVTRAVNPNPNRRYLGETDFFHDAGGVGREVYSIVCADLFSSALGMFRFSDIDNLTYCIDPNAGHSKEWLRLFRFAGRFLGKALVDGVIVPAHLSAVLYKQLLHVPIQLEDVLHIDSQVHASLQVLLTPTPTALQRTANPNPNPIAVDAQEQRLRSPLRDLFGGDQKRAHGGGVDARVDSEWYPSRCDGRQQAGLRRRAGAVDDPEPDRAPARGLCVWVLGGGPL